MLYTLKHYTKSRKSIEMTWKCLEAFGFRVLPNHSDLFEIILTQFGDILGTIRSARA